MKKLFTLAKKKINGIILTLVSTGVLLLFLGVLIVWTNFILRLLVGLLVIIMAYVAFYTAYRIWSLKKEVEKFFKL